jgi:hypothetical protein
MAATIAEEKFILKMVTAIFAETAGNLQKRRDLFPKAERYYCTLTL